MSDDFTGPQRFLNEGNTIVSSRTTADGTIIHTLIPNHPKTLVFSKVPRGIEEKQGK